ncbi:MAG: hypothetical protein EXQ84_01615 [Rhodospirillaceae bacterium]|nr:hypothetical protein [Rhodospirillaceae bacterium]
MNGRRLARRPDRSRLQHGLRWIGALALLNAVLILPDRITELNLSALSRLPVELPLIVLTMALLAGRARAVLRGAIVAALAAMLLLKIANMAVYFGFDRPFNPLVDVLMVPTALDTLGKTGGMGAAAAAVLVAVLIVAMIVAVLTWSTGVLAQDVAREARLSLAAGAALVAALGFSPYATTAATVFVRDQAVATSQGLRDAAQFRAQLLEDPFGKLPPLSRLAKLKGNDVLLIFVESYGRASLDNPAYAALLRGNLRRFGDAVKAGGFSARSAWMTSPTFGGESYLAHSTAVSGLWVNNQQRYAQLLRSRRPSLISDFNGAGWRTVAVMPEITMPWPEAAYFGYGKIYSAPELAYKGESFDYLTMPDQYTLAVFHNYELAPIERAPVMAEIAMISSHIPWAPIPKLVPWADVGDGRIFTTARTPETANEIWRDAKRVAEYYALSVDYTLQTLMSFVTTHGRDNMLLIILGDHQPMTFIAGAGANHEVPVHIIARDPELLAALDEGTWTEGMEPDKTSPSWPMDSLRGRILGAFTPAADATLSLQPGPIQKP